MSQINKYADKAAYEADTARLRTLSSESYIENDGVLLYDGVNAVIPKSAAGVGDLVVFDKTDGVLKFIKGATLVADKMPAELVPAGVVYGRHGDKVRIVSLENAIFNGSDEMRWANSYEVALSGFDRAAGGTAVLTFGTGIYKVDLPLTWGAGAKLSDIHAQINSFVTGQIKDYGWTSSVDEANSRIIMSSNTWSPVFSTIGVVSGCQITRPPEDVDYQTTLTGALIEGEKEYIRRNNGVDISFAGCNYKMFMQHYSVHGVEKNGQQPGSSDIIRESVFTEADNPALVAAYATYRDYLFGEHLAQYPSAYGAMVRDGRMNTAKIGKLRFVNIYGESVICYPAAAAALDYGVTVEGMTTGLEAGAWWLPSAEELFILMRDRVLGFANVEDDPVNRTLYRLGKTTCYGSGRLLWTSCEYSLSSAFLYNMYAGVVGVSDKWVRYSTRPVSAL